MGYPIKTGWVFWLLVCMLLVDMDASAYIRILKGKSLVQGARSIFPIDNTTATEILAATPPEVFRGVEVKGCCVSTNAASITILIGNSGSSPFLSIQSSSGTIQIDGGAPISFSDGFNYTSPASSFVINSSNLTNIYIAGYTFTSFNCNPAQQTILESLTIRQTNISTFISSPYVNLHVLDLGDNMLTTLNIASNPLLTNLDCGGNQLTALNLTANPLLTIINCSLNQLTTLNLSANPLLTHIGCKSNQLTTLNLTANPLLTNIICDSNQLTALNLSANPLLTSIVCGSNQLTSLDITANTVLETLDCSSNQLTSLDITTNTALYEILLSGNNLSQSAANAIVATLDTAGLTSGTLDFTNQLPVPIVNLGTGSWLNLTNNGWTILT